jgi:hypothetical protein
MGKLLRHVHIFIPDSEVSWLLCNVWSRLEEFANVKAGRNRR